MISIDHIRNSSRKEIIIRTKMFSLFRILKMSRDFIQTLFFTHLCPSFYLFVIYFIFRLRFYCIVNTVTSVIFIFFPPLSRVKNQLPFGYATIFFLCFRFLILLYVFLYVIIGLVKCKIVNYRYRNHYYLSNSINFYSCYA